MAAGDSQTVQGTKTEGLPAWLQPYGEDLMARGQALTGSNAAPVYGGTRVAGLTPGQTGMVNSVSGLNAGNLATQGSGLVAQGANYAPSTGAFGLESAQQYMSPYQQAVTDVAKREATRDAGIAQTGLDSKAAISGAFGGSRQAIMDAEAQRNLGTRLSDIQTQGLNTSWNQAQQQYNADQNRQQQDRQFGSQANIKGGAELGDLGKTAFGMQGAAGQLEQGTQQKGFDTDYQTWLGQQAHPYENLSFQKSLIQGFPGTTSVNNSTTTQNEPKANWLEKAAGIGSAAAGVANIFGFGDGKGGWLSAQGGIVPPAQVRSGLGQGRVAQLYASLNRGTP